MVEMILAFLKEYYEFIYLVVGIFCLAGSVLNWDWVVDPKGKPYHLTVNRPMRRIFYFVIGVLLCGLSAYLIFKRFA